MPAPMNDNTFFVLYALTKCPILNIESLSLLFKGWKIEKIFKEFDTLVKCGVKIRLKFYPNTDASIEELEKIEQYKEDIINVINNPQTINDCSAVVKKLLPYCIADISCSAEPEKVKEKIDEYLTKSAEDRKKYFCTIERHAEVFKKVKNWAEKTQTVPYKIGIDRFIEQTNERNNSKYAFFHFLYEQEKAKVLEISELNFSDNKPHIVFEKWKGKIHKPKIIEPIGKPIGTFEVFTLYENGIGCSINDKFAPIEPIPKEVFKYCFNAKAKTFDDKTLQQFFGVSKDIKSLSKRLSNCQKQIRELLQDEYKDVKIFVRNKKEKAYDLKFIFTKKE